MIPVEDSDSPICIALILSPAHVQGDAKAISEKKDRDERLRQQWAAERKRIDRILDDVFSLSTSALLDPGVPQMDQPPVASLRHDPVSDPTSDARYINRIDPRDLSGIGRMSSLDDSRLSGFTPALYSDHIRRPIYETRVGRNESADHMYQSIRNPSSALDFLPSHTRSNVWGPTYQGGPARSAEMGVAPGISYVRDSPSPIRGFPPLDTTQHLSPRLYETLPDGALYASIPRQGADVARMQQENESLQRIVARQQEQLDQTLSLIGQPNTRVGRTEKRSSKDSKSAKQGRAPSANGRKQRKVVPIDSTRPLDGPNTASAWTVRSLLQKDFYHSLNIQGGPERMQQLWYLISRTSSIKRNWFWFYYVENSFSNKMTPWSLMLGKVSES